MNQNQALNLLKLGKNIFLTGAAGAGKTWLLNSYIKYLHEHNVEVAVSASTGIAATHLNGKTIHSWSGIGVRDSLTDEDINKLSKNSRIKRNYVKAKVLVIDEISMLQPEQLDMVDQLARSILDSKLAFGGLQVILCGDFFQLPPIRQNSTKKFAYEANSWQQGNFYICYLHEQHRQNNDPLLDVLSDIRSGNAGEQTKIPLRTRYKKEPAGETAATKLYTHNMNVDTVNNNELALLSETEHIFPMQTKGYKMLVEGLQKTCLAPAELRLKKGAQVMFVKNANDGSFCNGTRAVIVGFHRTEGYPVVKTFDGRIITARPEDWKLEENGTVRATISQVPLRLAWAITIHKSQGMTLDAAEIDLGNAFEPGMGYVALSRVRRLSGLKLINLNEIALKVHPDILERDKIFKQESTQATRYLEEFKDMEEQQQEVLVRRFRGSKEKLPIIEGKVQRPQRVATHNITLLMLKDKMKLAEIATARELTISTVINHIEKLQGLQTLPDITYIRKEIKTNDFDIMFDELSKSEDGKLSPIHEKLDGKYSYDDLRLVRLFVEN